MKKIISLLLMFSSIYSSAALPPTRTKVIGDVTPVNTFDFDFPNFTATRNGRTTTFGVLGVAGGGTGQTTPLIPSQAGNNGKFLTTDGSVASWVAGGVSGITSINGLAGAAQTFAVGTAGTDFNINSATTIHTFNIPSSSAANRGLLTSADWTSFNTKANLASPAFSGTPTSTTPSASDNSTKIATTAYVDNQVNIGSTLTSVAKITEDFLNNGHPFVSTNSGTGSIGNTRAANSNVNHIGIWSQQTGTTTTGYSSIIGSNQDEIFPLGGGVTTFEIIISLNALGNVTDNYTFLAGFRTLAYNYDITPQSGIWFSYNYATSANWILNAGNAGTISTSDTGVAVVGSNSTFHRLTWVLNSAGTSVQAYVNGTLAGTAISTNLPTTSQKGMLFDIIKKSAGTTNITCNLDAISFSVMLASSR